MRGIVVDFDATLLERIAQEFRRDMWESVVDEAVTESGIEVERFGPVQASAFGELPAIPVLNQIQGAGEAGAVSDGHLAAAIEWMRAREVDCRIFIAEGRPESAEAEAWLGARGYERGDGWVTFVRDAAPSRLRIEPGIKIWPLGENEIDGEGLSAILSEGMDLPLTAETLFFSLPQRPRWRCYTASIAPDDRVAAAASMRIHEGVAQFGPGSTLEYARGRGCNTALLQRRLVDAIAAGCHTIFAEVWDCQPERFSAVGRSLVRAGFEPAYSVRNWQRPALRPATTQRFRAAG
jgi:hypothetical protein